VRCFVALFTIGVAPFQPGRPPYEPNPTCAGGKNEAYPVPPAPSAVCSVVWARHYLSGLVKRTATANGAPDCKFTLSGRWIKWYRARLLLVIYVLLLNLSIGTRAFTFAEKSAIKSLRQRKRTKLFTGFINFFIGQPNVCSAFWSLSTMPTTQSGR